MTNSNVVPKLCQIPGSIYTTWSTAGYNGSSQDFQQLKWTEPQLPQHFIRADGIGHVSVIVNLKQRLGIYVGRTVKNMGFAY
jgi:hypothetical protein